MQTYRTGSLGMHKGAPRLWIEGKFPERAGFRAGAKFNVVQDENHLVLRLHEDGERVVSYRLSGTRTTPIIEINNRELLNLFPVGSALRMVMSEGEIVISQLASAQRRRVRTMRLLDKLKRAEPLNVAALAFGGGVLDHALHEGLKEAGVEARLTCVNEIREDLMEHAAEHNEIVTRHTQALIAPLQEIAYDRDALDRVGSIDLLTAGLPCSGASVAGRAKRGLSHPEEHPLVGHLVASAISIIAIFNPSAIVLEQVPTYAKSASASILRTSLRELGYQVHEREFLATEWGDLERRTRWCMVALTRGIEFDFESLRPKPFEVRTLGEVLEPFEDIVERFSRMQGLKDKEARDRAAGKGFQMQLYTGEETSINTLTKGIQKNRSTDPKIRHPSDPDLLRIPTAREHARCKGVPEHLIGDLSQTTAHELLGQAVCYSPFKALGAHLGEALKRFGRNVAHSTGALWEGLDAPSMAAVG